MTAREDPCARDLRLRRRALEIVIGMPESAADAHAILVFAIEALRFVNPTGMPKLVPIPGGKRRVGKAPRAQ